MELKTRFSPLALPFLLLLLFLFSGCGTTGELAGKRDPKELYDKAMEAYRIEKFEESEKAFKTLMEDYPLSPLSVDAQLMLGDVCYAMERYDDASSYYTNFAALHPTHPRASYALFQKGMSHFRDILSIDRDQTSTKKALFAFEDLVAGYPGSPYVAKARELISFLKARLAEREIYIGRFYYKSKNYKGALARLRDLIRTYPDSTFTPEALYLIGESYLNLGEKRLSDEAFSTLITNFPDSPFTGDAKSRLKES